MSNIAMRVSDLGKRYRIGTGARTDTLCDKLAHLAAAPFRYLRNSGSEKADSNFSHIWALKNVSFEIGSGEVVGIIGRNGAGKSTLLKILSRITKPTEGEAEISGRVGSLLEVGTGFHPELTGRENIYLNGAILGMRRKEIDRKFDEIVDFAEVEKFIDTPVKHYSSGMYMRLAFAVAAHLEPEILLVDEVLAVGDYEFQKKCLGKMRDVGHEGRTVIVVSHNLPSVLNLCEHAILLDDGKVVVSGPSAQVVERYVQATKSLGGEVVWPTPDRAPGNHMVRLHSVRVLQGGTSGSAEVDISKEVSLEITYWNLKEGSVLIPSIWLRDQMGTVVLTSANYRSGSLDHDPWREKPFPAGLFRSVCTLPANFLNDGLYTLAAVVNRGTESQVFQDYALSFHVQDTGEMRKEYLGPWPGTVRPKLAWHTEHLVGRGQMMPASDGPGAADLRSTGAI